MEPRVRIVDIAEELGLSTATVSNVIHGKTKKISDETVKRVQELLEKKQYIPSMAGILLAQNNSRIIGVVVHDHEKYESHVLEDSFITSSLNYLSHEIERAGYFMMVKTTDDCEEIIRFASMWNMEGFIIIGFCEQDYNSLRARIRIPFVVYDGYFEGGSRICNLTIDNFDGGYQMGNYFYELGHTNVLCISDNDTYMDHQRYQGFRKGMQEHDASLLLIPMQKEARKAFYQKHIDYLLSFSAVFAVSDYYAVDLMHFLLEVGVNIPQDISVAGFDDCAYCEMVYPRLTTIRQDSKRRAELAIEFITGLKKQTQQETSVLLPVQLVIRDSTKEN